MAASEEAIREAQDFFWSLYQEVAPGPINDEAVYNQRITELNRCLGRLTAGGLLLPDRAYRATFEAFTPAIMVTAGVEGVEFTQNPTTAARLEIDYAECGFCPADAPMAFQWRVREYLEGLPQGGLFADMRGNVGRLPAGAETLYRYVEERHRGLTVVANHLSSIFNPMTTVHAVPSSLYAD